VAIDPHPESLARGRLAGNGFTDDEIEGGGATFAALWPQLLALRSLQLPVEYEPGFWFAWLSNAEPR
jgi:hypothetical protein